MIFRYLAKSFTSHHYFEQDMRVIKESWKFLTEKKILDVISFLPKVYFFHVFTIFLKSLYDYTRQKTQYQFQQFAVLMCVVNCIVYVNQTMW